MPTSRLIVYLSSTPGLAPLYREVSEKIGWLPQGRKQFIEAFAKGPAELIRRYRPEPGDFDDKPADVTPHHGDDDRQ